jgi:amino acid adenylation domain-containing protein
MVEKRLQAGAKTAKAGGGSTATAIQRRPDPTRPAPLSSAQLSLWLLNELFPESRAYNVPIIHRLVGPLDFEALGSAVAALVRRHEILRSVFRLDDRGEVVQEVLDHLDVPLEILPVEGDSAAERLAASEQVLSAFTLESFDLRHGPLLRTCVIRLDQDDHLFTFAFHHAVFDHWSVKVLTRDLAEFYRAHLEDREPALPPMRIQYADFAVWQRDHVQTPPERRQLDWWRERLDGMSATLDLPNDHPFPVRPGFVGARVSTQVTPALVERLRGIAKRHDVTLFMILAASLQALLYRYTGQRDFGVAVAVSNRSKAELEGLVGFFVNTVVLRADVTGATRFDRLLTDVKENSLAAFERSSTPFVDVVRVAHPDRDLARHPIAQVGLSFLNSAGDPLSLPGISAHEVTINPGIVRYDIDIFVSEIGGGIKIDIDYRTDIFKPETVEWFGEHLLKVLTDIAENPQRTVGDLRLFGESHTRWLATQQSSTASRSLSADRSLSGQRFSSTPELVPELVARATAERPDAPAVLAGGDTLTYRGLARQANRLAHHLRELGVGRGGVVGVLLPRGADLVVAALAVMRVGAAYLPLDPEHPSYRLRHMLDDSAAAAVISRSDTVAGHALLTTSERELVLLDSDQHLLAGPDSAPDVVLGPADAAYVVYTSGSTGRPKGTLVPHAGLANLCAWHHRRYRLSTTDRGLLLASPGFDASVWELWPYLSAGASVAVVDDKVRTDPSALVTWLGNHAITKAFLPTPLAEAVLNVPNIGQLTATTLLTGGDRLRVRPPAGIATELINHYGPTECSVVATAAVVPPAGGGAPEPITIGRPIDGVTVHVLDEVMAEVPLGARGELYLGGVGLAHGYLGQPGLTAERFVPNPYGCPGDRLYRTGDVVRWRAGAAADPTDGALEFVGRCDRQLKIRGHRIEPGEIERQLTEHPLVSTAFVALLEGQLVGYVVASATWWVPGCGGGFPSTWCRRRSSLCRSCLSPSTARWT